MRGGKREGAGCKSNWKHGKTKTIRVPIALAKKILECARKLDEGVEIADSKTINLSGIPIRAYNGKAIVLLEDLYQKGFEILPERLGRSVRLRSQR